MTGHHVVLFLLYVSSATSIVINTPSGRIRGISVPHGSQQVYQFRNIPYAKPPIGNLRFRKPEPYGSWSHIRDGTTFGNVCMQESRSLSSHSLMSEDCLSLNVYVPVNFDGPNSHAKSVMIWVHGGAYLVGSGSRYNGMNLAVTGDVIVVTINYRLGMFGFLSTENDAAKGNYGLWDQHLAFKWVQHNIWSFGGNPNSVTIFGESAGAFSVALQSLYTGNKGMFQRVIAESGVSNSFASLTGRAKYQSNRYGRLLGCQNSTDTYNLVSCIRTKTATDILKAQLTPDIIDRVRYGVDPSPVVDGEIIVAMPETLLNNTASDEFKFFSSLDFLTGNNNKEGTLLMALVIPPYNSLLHVDVDIGISSTKACSYLVEGLVDDLFPGNKKHLDVKHLLCDYYRGNDPGQQTLKMMDMFGDALFVAPAVTTLDFHSRNNTQSYSYQYMFNRPSHGGSNTYYNVTVSAHGAELPFLFGFPKSLDNVVAQEDISLSTKMCKYWTNFAKTRNPNGDGLPFWPQYDAKSRKYLNLDTSISIMDNVFQDRVDLWTKRIPNLLNSSSGSSLFIPIGIVGK